MDLKEAKVRRKFEEWARSEWGERSVPDNAWLGFRAGEAAGSLNARNVYEVMQENSLRMERIVLLAGMANDGESIAEQLSDLLEEDPEVLTRCFPDMPTELASLEETDEFKEAFFDWAHRTQKWGFVVQFGRPVMAWNAAGTSATFSWGYYNTVWLYGESMEEAIERAVAWGLEVEAKEQAKRPAEEAQGEVE